MTIGYPGFSLGPFPPFFPSPPAFAIIRYFDPGLSAPVDNPPSDWFIQRHLQKITPSITTRNCLPASMLAALFRQSQPQSVRTLPVAWPPSDQTSRRAADRIPRPSGPKEFGTHPAQRRHAHFSRALPNSRRSLQQQPPGRTSVVLDYLGQRRRSFALARLRASRLFNIWHGS